MLFLKILLIITIVLLFIDFVLAVTTSKNEPKQYGKLIIDKEYADALADMRSVDISKLKEGDVVGLYVIKMPITDYMDKEKPQDSQGS